MLDEFEPLIEFCEGALTDPVGTALAPTEEAVDVARGLVESDVRHQPRLVEALTVRFAALAQVGRWQDAIEAIEEMITRLRLLEPADLPDLDVRFAEAFSELGQMHAYAGTHAAAARHAAESARRYADLTATVHVGRELLNVCQAVAEGGGAAVAELDTGFADTLSRFQPDDRTLELHPELGAALNGVAKALNAAGRSSEALPAVTKSIEMLIPPISVYEGNREDYAAALSTLVHVHCGLNDDTRALEFARENVELIRPWTVGHDMYHTDKVAHALDDVAIVLTRLGRTEEARSVMNEAADWYERQSYLGRYLKLAELRRAGSLQPE